MCVIWSKVEKEFNVPSELQKWVLGKNIANNLNAPLSAYGITHSGCPIFLYVLPLPQMKSCINNLGNTFKPFVAEMPKPNGNLSDDDDNIYESLRPSSANSYSSYTSMDQITNCNKVPPSEISPIVCVQNPLSVMNPVYSSEKFSTIVTPVASTSSEVLINNKSSNLVKDYFYNEGEVLFTGELVFEGLSMVNELLPRVEEEDEDDLEDEEDNQNEITVKDLNGNTTNVLSGATTEDMTTYQKLIELEDAKCVVNIEPFDCPICFGEFKSGEGVVLRECLHTFCR